jgi:hypothetical protein
MPEGVGMREFFLVDRGDAMPGWCELVRDEARNLRWMDVRGLTFPRHEGWPLAHVEGDGPDATFGADPGIAAMERAFACVHLLDPWSNQGWVAPNGRFYGCRFSRHEDLMHAFLRKRVGAAEAEGFVRVHDDSFRPSEYGPRSGRVTPQQAATLAALGFDPPVPGQRRARAHEPDRALPPPAFAVRPAPGIVLPPPRRERAAPTAEAAPPRPDPEPAARDALLARLRGDPRLAGLLAGDPDHDGDFGGRWGWMLRFADFDLGAEEPASELLAEPGLDLDETAFDQVEIRPGAVAGVRVTPEALAVLRDRAGRMGAPAP